MFCFICILNRVRVLSQIHYHRKLLMKKFLTPNLQLNNLYFSQVGKCHCDCFVHDSPPLLAVLPSQLQLPLHHCIYKSLSCQLCAGTCSKSILAPSPVTILSRGAVPRLAHLLPLQVPQPAPRCHGSVQARTARRRSSRRKYSHSSSHICQCLAAQM